jgi:hypothetical protein
MGKDYQAERGLRWFDKQASGKDKSSIDDIRLAKPIKR